MTVNQNGTVESAQARILGIISEQEPTEPVTEELEELEAEPETPESDTEEELYTVKVNGEEKRVSLEELRKGYMMESDYRQKTSQVSKKRELLDEQQAKLEKELDEARSFIEFEAAELDSPEMQELKDYDPEAYWKRVDAVKTKAERFKKTQEKQRARLEEKHAELIRQEQEKLKQAIPDWIDTEKMTSETNKLTSLLRSSGFTDSEISSFSDHRLIVLARKAMLYDAINSGDVDSKKVKKAPISAQPASKQPALTAKQKRTQEAKARLRDTGRVNHAQLAIKNILFGE